MLCRYDEKIFNQSKHYSTRNQNIPKKLSTDHQKHILPILKLITPNISHQKGARQIECEKFLIKKSLSVQHIRQFLI